MSTRGRKPGKPTDGPYAEDAFAPPPYLGEIATAAYLRLVGDLKKSGNLSRTDPGLVEAYAINAEVLASAYAALQKDGHYVASDRGNTSPHPALSAVNQATLRLKTLANELGLTPTSLGIVTGGAKKKEGSTLSALINGGND